MSPHFSSWGMSWAQDVAGNTSQCEDKNVSVKMHLNASFMDSIVHNFIVLTVFMLGSSCWCYWPGAFLWGDNDGLFGQLHHGDAAGLLPHAVLRVSFLFYSSTERDLRYSAQLLHCSIRRHMWLHVQTWRWQMAGKEIRGEGSPLAELTLKESGRMWSRRGAKTPLQGEPGLNILPAWAAETQLQSNEEWADLPSPSLLRLSPLTLLRLIMDCSWLG